MAKATKEEIKENKAIARQVVTDFNRVLREIKGKRSGQKEEALFYITLDGTSNPIRDSFTKQAMKDNPYFTEALKEYM